MAATPDHFYTTSETERDGARDQYGYKDEGTACFVYSPNQERPPLTVPLYRLYIGGDAHNHYYTTSEDERSGAISKYGYTAEGITCYVFPPNQAQPQGTVPLYRLYSDAQVDHFYTISPEGRDQAQSEFGYKDEGIACYVFADPRNYALQDGWRYCKKCQGLFFAGVFANVEQSDLKGCLPSLFSGSAGLGKCPAGGGHDKGESGDYRLINGDRPVVSLFRLYDDPATQWLNVFPFCVREPDMSEPGHTEYVLARSYDEALVLIYQLWPGRDIEFGWCVPFSSQTQSLTEVQTTQDEWRWCRKCQGLFFAGVELGRCPAGGGHDKGESNYILAKDNYTVPGQDDWRWCGKCQGLFFAGSGAGKCPAGGGHDKSESGNYRL